MSDLPEELVQPKERSGTIFLVIIACIIIIVLAGVFVLFRNTHGVISLLPIQTADTSTSSVVLEHKQETKVLQGMVTEIDPESGMFQIYSSSDNVVYTINPDTLSDLQEEIISGTFVQIEAVPDVEDNALFHAKSINPPNNPDYMEIAMPPELAPASEYEE